MFGLVPRSSIYIILACCNCLPAHACSCVLRMHAVLIEVICMMCGISITIQRCSIKAICSVWLWLPRVYQESSIQHNPFQARESTTHHPLPPTPPLAAKMRLRWPQKCVSPAQHHPNMKCEQRGHCRRGGKIRETKKRGDDHVSGVLPAGSQQRGDVFICKSGVRRPCGRRRSHCTRTHACVPCRPRW
jgi:hypothetical protein